MKRRMPLRKTLGKISTFLRQQRGNNKSTSANRASVRISMGVRSDYPSSTKIGSGATTARRKNIASHFKKINHRSNRVIRNYERE